MSKSPTRSGRSGALRLMLVCTARACPSPEGTIFAPAATWTALQGVRLREVDGPSWERHHPNRWAPVLQREVEQRFSTCRWYSPCRPCRRCRPDCSPLFPCPTGSRPHRSRHPLTAPRRWPRRCRENRPRRPRLRPCAPPSGAEARPRRPRLGGVRAGAIADCAEPTSDTHSCPAPAAAESALGGIDVHVRFGGPTTRSPRFAAATRAAIIPARMGCELLMANPPPCIMPWPAAGTEAFLAPSCNDAAETVSRNGPRRRRSWPASNSRARAGQWARHRSGNPRKVRSGRSASGGAARAIVHSAAFSSSGIQKSEPRPVPAPAACSWAEHARDAGPQTIAERVSLGHRLRCQLLSWWPTPPAWSPGWR